MDRVDEIRERLNGYTGLILAMPQIQQMYEDALLLLAEAERLEAENAALLKDLRNAWPGNDTPCHCCAKEKECRTINGVYRILEPNHFGFMAEDGSCWQWRGVESEGR